MQVFRSGGPYHAATGCTSTHALPIEIIVSRNAIQQVLNAFCRCTCGTCTCTHGTLSGRVCMLMYRSLKQGEDFDDDMEVELVAEPAVGSSAAHHSFSVEDDAASRVQPQSLLSVCPYNNP